MMRPLRAHFLAGQAAIVVRIDRVEPLGEVRRLVAELGAAERVVPVGVERLQLRVHALAPVAALAATLLACLAQFLARQAAVAVAVHLRETLGATGCARGFHLLRAQLAVAVAVGLLEARFGLRLAFGTARGFVGGRGTRRVFRRGRLRERAGRAGQQQRGDEAADLAPGLSSRRDADTTRNAARVDRLTCEEAMGGRKTDSRPRVPGLREGGDERGGDSSVVIRDSKAHEPS
jgi:hypothetical protein